MEFTSTHNQPMTIEHLRRRVPSAFAERAHAGVSDRYEYFPTLNVITALMSEGWEPTAAQEQRIRTEDRRGFQKHMIRFRRPTLASRHRAFKVGDTFPEFVIVNAHDGSAAWKAYAGLFRLVCSNGLVVGAGNFDAITIRHSGNNVHDVIDATYEIVERLPEIGESVERMQARQLTDREQFALAAAALALRYETPAQTPITPEKALTRHRSGDEGRDLWSTFNVLQENLTKGGLSDPSRRSASGRRLGKVRAITGIDQGLGFNRALWTLATILEELGDIDPWLPSEVRRAVTAN